MSSEAVLQRTERGLYCPAGDFFIDPWQPVARAVVTHAHADHARWGCGSYLTSAAGAGVLRVRMAEKAVVETLPFGARLRVGRADVSLHPAGHILGSAQVRVEVEGEVWVVSGDYKTEPDPTCAAFEPVRCHTFVTESTFGLPVYRWQPQSEIFAEVHAWWRANQEAGRASLLFAYALGKAQRLLAGLDGSVGPVFVHGAVDKLNAAYRAGGVKLVPCQHTSAAPKGFDWSRALVVAPPSAQGTPWMRKFGDVSTAFASGWMRIRGPRRRRAVDRGFVLSDHADWPGLLDAIRGTGAARVLVTHGYTAVMARWLQEHGYQAETVATAFEGERDDAAAGEPEAGEDA